MSIDSFQPATYVGIRAVDNPRRAITLNRCRDFLHGLRGRGHQNVEVAFTIQKRNIEELLDVESLMHGINHVVPAGVAVRFKFATGKGATVQGEPGAGEFLPDADQLARLYARWRVWQPAPRRSPINVDFVRTALDSPAKRAALASGYPLQSLWQSLSAQGARCEVMKYTMFIDSRGRVFPCCYLFNDNVAAWALRDEYALGSWREERTASPQQNALRVIWGNTAYGDLRARGLGSLPKAACARCTRHMVQNAFLTAIEGSLGEFARDADGSARDRALKIYDDVRDIGSRPVWL